MDVWYPMLKSITFNSYFKPLNYKEAVAIISYHKYRLHIAHSCFTKKETKILILLQQKIDYYFNTNYDDIKKRCNVSPFREKKIKKR